MILIIIVTELWKNLKLKENKYLNNTQDIIYQNRNIQNNIYKIKHLEMMNKLIEKKK